MMGKGWAKTDKDGKSAAVSESPSAYGPGMLGSVKQNGGWHPWARFEEPSIWQQSDLSCSSPCAAELRAVEHA